MKKLLLSAIAATAFFSISAFAADMPQRPVYKAAPASQLFNWSGLYVGGYAGWMDANSRDVTSGSPEVKVDGGAFGGLAGVNWQTNNLVFGLEADGGWSNADHGTDGIAFLNFKDRFVGNARVRMGLAFDRLLFFVAGGASFADEKIVHGGLGGNDTQSKDRVGWTIGGGVDWAATQNLIFRIEYLYADFDTKTYTFFAGTDPHSVKYDGQNTVRAAAIWKW